METQERKTLKTTQEAHNEMKAKIAAFEETLDGLPGVPPRKQQKDLFLTDIKK